MGSSDGTCGPVTESLGAKANTSLSAAITTTTGTSVSVASTTGMVVDDYLQIDSEIMEITAISPLAVSRGQLGTTAATHVSGDAVQDIQDWVYLSVTAGGDANGSTCTGACLYNFNVTTGATLTDATTGIAATGGTSGIIVDNSLTGTGESQSYYTTLGNATCGAMEPQAPARSVARCRRRNRILEFRRTVAGSVNVSRAEIGRTRQAQRTRPKLNGANRTTIRGPRASRPGSDAVFNALAQPLQHVGRQ